MTDTEIPAPVTTCAHCGTGIYREPDVGWVDATSGDDGGTYDVCPESGDGHTPR